MKPGATRRPEASISRAPVTRGPISVMRPSEMPTSARRAGAPLPSTSVPPRTAISCPMAPPLRAERVGDGKRLDPADHARVEAPGLARALDALEPPREVAEGGLHLHARQVRPEAEVLAHAEGEVAVRVAPDVEALRRLEDRLVAVRRGVEEHEELARSEEHTSELQSLRHL